ncbi:hypothetical protein C731_3877 [Mycolicibacterium hassiacum DSM 44199]|uniref:Uncharacterized protein n=1 Tax=Mycolicibacterium hassiacum (strain DSM 44199 / CIP 105218 / JCM 12690 / 3849) TaxID=1122247 RepID=K5BAF1_MYCHD|nr:hypothetical protein [Mycolicibacterium hassiacum]EKF22130.1 hypothetical protein C731_3877 [Mycolicibacterium hassiacum DSM 44199]MDA4086574.1 hypothetical protein [Mycolicibacterium hassiacum DSM 44199]VCT92031.1 hypothetical protein MHAS_03755 [Mycolicibacterium hassiacum DSM 44199]
MTTYTGPLVPADDHLNHQIADTFATVCQTDRAWTEKVAASAYGPDGELELLFGLGKYTNRGVIDAFGGVSRGTDQWTVRASRELTPVVDAASVGPLHYQVIEPMQQVRFALDPNDIVPISFEWTFTAAVPAQLENREQHRSLGGARLEADLVRYHQIGTARGWVEVDGRRTEFDDTWVSTRDHSWGVRYFVGKPVTDIPPPPDIGAASNHMIWMPALMRRDDGSRYGLHLYYQASTSELVGASLQVQGGVEYPDGRRVPVVGATPDLKYRPDNRRLLGGTIDLVLAGGEHRQISVKPISDTGFHLGTGLYFGFDGDIHGVWHGPLHVTGEYIGNCDDPQVARRIHQLRDCVVEVVDHATGAQGIGNAQTMVLGAPEGLGLDAESSFL